MSKVHKMLQMAGVGPGDLVYDLGCGDGRTIVTAARQAATRGQQLVPHYRTPPAKVWLETGTQRRTPSTR